MPTIVTHAIVPLAAAVALGSQRIPARVACCGAALAMLPDADVVGFAIGINYADSWGHRGASHSLLFAALLALPLSHALERAGGIAARAGVWLFLFLATASHGLLDMATSGGLGVALLWPWEETRHFWGWRPVRVSPIGAAFFSARGLETLLSELRWVWLPALLAGGAGWLVRHGFSRSS